jgi:hypothetical protein
VYPELLLCIHGMTLCGQHPCLEDTLTAGHCPVLRAYLQVASMTPSSWSLPQVAASW